MLPFETAPCPPGKHGPFRNGAPIDRGETVHVDHICERCGEIPHYTSWNKHAWLKAQAKKVTRGR